MSLPTPPKDSKQAANYKDYRDDSVYKHEPGVIVVPRVGNTPLAIRVHQPYSKRIRKVRGVKSRTPPVINAPAATETVLAQEIAFPLPRATSGNPPVFEFAIEATYVTLETGETTPIDDGLVGGRYPMSFPLLSVGQQAAYSQMAFGAVGGGAAVASPLFLTPPFSTGAYQWPWTDVSHAFFARDAFPFPAQ